MITVLELRQELEAALSGRIGTYTLSNGETTNAISVRAPGERLLPQTQVSGIEVVIKRDPEQQVVTHYRLPGTLDRWVVYLIGWSGGSADLAGAADAVLNVFQNTTITDLSVPEGIGPQHQKRLDILLDPMGFRIPEGNLLMETGDNLLLESGAILRL